MIINQNAADMSLYDNLVNRELMHIKCFHEPSVDNKIAVIMPGRSDITQITNSTSSPELLCNYA